MQVIVLGMHRSGTSATAGLLVKLGAYFGPEGIAMPPADDNANGYWERRDVVAANDALLAASEARWFAPLRYDLSAVSALDREAFARAARPIADELSSHAISMIKDPRLCVTFDAWRPLFRRPVCLLVLRHPLSSARSLESRRDGGVRAGLALWEFHMRAVLRHTRGLPATVVDYDQLVADPARVAGTLVRDLNRLAGAPLLREPAQGEADTFIDHRLRHHVHSEEDLQAVATAGQVELYRQLRTVSPEAIPDLPLDRDTVHELQLHELAIEGERLRKHRDQLTAALQRLSGAAAPAEVALRQIALRTELHAALAVSRGLRGGGSTLDDLHLVLTKLDEAQTVARRFLPE